MPPKKICRMVSELTEITESAEAGAPGGWIFYDADCRSCRDLALRFEKFFAARGFHFEPLQHEWVQRRLNLTKAQALEEMRVLTSAGQVFGGADAVIFLARQVWWAAPVAWLARLPLVQAVLDTLYRWIAARRTCAINGAPVPSFVSRTRWFALAILPLIALATKPFLPAWGFMWMMAFALFFGCKWLTLGTAIRRKGRAGPFRALAYLIAWPGMAATRFLSSEMAPHCSRSVALRTAVVAVVRILLGSVLLFGVARGAANPLLAGWIGMVGMILLLHFGFFKLLSLGWRALRVDAPPIMNAPLRSTSVSEFWGERWNAAFNDLALRLVFRPAVRVIGIAGATLLAFLVSGLVHEFVISLPANAGYGLPTGYFLIQGLGVLTERSSVGKWLGLRTCGRGWWFTMIVVAGPAYWLFHPPFVRQVIVPFMQAIGAL
jgi:predicted DCC family thiol-disulfide oxidoreductase YuxK